MKKKYSIFAILGILIVFLIMFCIHIRNKNNLDNWIGQYYYSETYPHNSGEIFYFIEYTITIYKEENKYYAQIVGDGWQTMDRMSAQVTGDRDKIEITYLQCLPDDLLYGCDSYYFDKGEALWRFEREGSDINTVWLAGKIFFESFANMDGEIITKSFEKVAQTEPETLMKEPELSDIQKEREGSGVMAEENDRAGDAKDDVAAMCELVHAMDFTVEQPHMELTEEEDLAYKEAFLRLLKNELPIEGWYEDCYQDLWWAGIPYENLLEERDSARFPYFYYYDDIDGDGKPEFGVSQGAVYFFDYELGEDACSASYGEQSSYFAKLLGVGKLLEYDCQHAWVERFRYVMLNNNGGWETVLEFQLYFAEDEEETIYTKYYLINGVDVGKENWEELAAPFYEAIECEIPKKTLTEVFGELLEVG